jgi:lipopolysaccharide export system permease protein
VRILTRYLVARFLGLFAAFLIVSTLTIVIVEMMLNLGDMLQGDRGMPGIASYLFLRLPAYYLRDLVPIVAFAAAFFTVGTAARWLELMAMKAGGVSPHRAAAPILFTGLALTAVTFLVNETVVLDASRSWNQRNSEANPIAFRQGSFWYQRGRTIYNIADADRTTNTLRGVQIYELDEDRQLIRSIEAESAIVDDQERWMFRSPLVRSFDRQVPAAPPVSTQHVGEVILPLADESGGALMNADVSTLSVGELQQLILEQQRLGRDPDRPRALLHARLAEPFAVLLFILAAIPLGVRVERAGSQNMTLPALYGILIVAAFFSLRSVTTTLTTEGLLPPSPVPWLVIAGFAGFGAWRYVEMPA